MERNARFDSMVFAGGGSRCLWQVGFWSRVDPHLGLSTARIAGVSAGAAMACMLRSGRMSASFERFKKATAENRRNFYPLNLFNERPLFPHLAMYRESVLSAIDEAALERIRNGPDILVLMTRPPRWSGVRMAMLIGMLCYAVEKKLFAPVHPTFASRAGFRSEVVSVRECATPDDLADLLLQSSCTPPFTPVMYRNGGPVLDGGLIDNVPVRILGKGSGNTLVLLTRSYREDRIPRIPGRTYVQPSRPITVYKWDYTNPQGLQDAFDLGCEDGERFLRYS
ncbi:MAG: patatin-like phospholipase family protein [Deltaproteobacteria bacterium]|nr:patatin-like phospholipase family protein [Deltaproteobacteria bacterium]